MKISIVVPVYNGEETIEACLGSLLNQDYPKKDFEIIVVDGGSTDGTPDIIDKVLEKAERVGINLRCLRSREREGRLSARIKGAEEATHNLLLFTDSRCTADRNILKSIRKIGYHPIVGNPLVEFGTPLSRFHWLIRRKLYYPYFGEEFIPIYIETENFDKIGKGTTVFFCSKELFLSSQPENRDEYASDDTKLLWNIVQERKILKHPEVKVTYLPRQSLKEEIKHTFRRGPKFVDYYLDLRKRKFWMFIFSPLFSMVLTISLLLVNFTYLLYWLSLLFFTLFVTSIWLSENVKDFSIVMALLPVLGIAFELGILKGLKRIAEKHDRGI